MNSYYLMKEKRIMREIKLALPHFRRFVAQAYGSELADIVVKETLEQFAALLPQLPYIGGDENRLTENLYLSAVMLAFYQALKVHGKPVEEVARIIYLGTESMCSMPCCGGKGEELSAVSGLKNFSAGLPPVSGSSILATGSTTSLKAMARPSFLVWTTPNAASSNTWKNRAHRNWLPTCAGLITRCPPPCG
jgi:hypothetical protein